MNIYFLVEGNSTEKKIYPQWLKYLIPELKRVKYFNEIEHNNYYLISGEGYPSILQDGLQNAVDKISVVHRHKQETQKYDYLVLCVDADEETVEERRNYIKSFIETKNLNLGQTKIEIIIQNRCFETWLLGNRRMFNSRQPLEPPLSDYANYYDVSQADPEKMGQYQMRNHADFHLKYLQAIFQARKTVYTKRSPGDAKEKYYLEQLQKRIEDESTHLQTFQNFLNFCAMIKQEISDSND